MRHSSPASGSWHPAEPGAPIPAVQVAVSRDGQVWQTADGGRAVPQWGWAGRTLFAAPDRLVEVALAPPRLVTCGW